MGVEAQSPAAGERMEPGAQDVLALLQAGNLLMGPFRLWAGLSLGLLAGAVAGLLQGQPLLLAKPGLRLEWVARVHRRTGR